MINIHGNNIITVENFKRRNTIGFIIKCHFIFSIKIYPEIVDIRGEKRPAIVT